MKSVLSKTVEDAIRRDQERMGGSITDSKARSIEELFGSVKSEEEEVVEEQVNPLSSFIPKYKGIPEYDGVDVSQQEPEVDKEITDDDITGLLIDTPDKDNRRVVTDGDESDDMDIPTPTIDPKNMGQAQPDSNMSQEEIDKLDDNYEEVHENMKESAGKWVPHKEVLDQIDSGAEPVEYAENTYPHEQVLKLRRYLNPEPKSELIDETLNPMAGIDDTQVDFKGNPSAAGKDPEVVAVERQGDAEVDALMSGASSFDDMSDDDITALFDTKQSRHVDSGSIFSGIKDVITDVAEYGAETGFDAAVGAAQGMLFEFGDEIAAGIGAVFTGEDDGTAGVFDKYLQRYEDLHKDTQEFVDDAYERSPVAYLLGDVAGGIGAALYSGGASLGAKAVGKGASMAGKKVAAEAGEHFIKRSLKGAAVAGTAGLGYGAGASEGGITSLMRDGKADKESIQTLVEDMAMGGVSGAVFGFGLPLAMTVGKKAFGYAGKEFHEVVQTAIQKNKHIAVGEMSERLGEHGYILDSLSPSKTADANMVGDFSTSAANIYQKGIDFLARRIYQVDYALGKELGDVIDVGFKNNPRKGIKANPRLENTFQHRIRDVFATAVKDTDALESITMEGGLSYPTHRELTGILKGFDDMILKSPEGVTPRQIKDLSLAVKSSILGKGGEGNAPYNVAKILADDLDDALKMVPGLEEATNAVHSYRSGALEAIINGHASDSDQTRRKFSDVKLPEFTELLNKNITSELLDTGAGRAMNADQALTKQLHDTLSKAKTRGNTDVAEALYGDRVFDYKKNKFKNRQDNITDYELINRFNADDVRDPFTADVNQLMSGVGTDIDDLAQIGRALKTTGTTNNLEKASSSAVGRTVKGWLGSGERFYDKLKNRRGLATGAKKVAGEIEELEAKLKSENFVNMPEGGKGLDYMKKANKSSTYDDLHGPRGALARQKAFGDAGKPSEMLKDLYGKPAKAYKDFAKMLKGTNKVGEYAGGAMDKVAQGKKILGEKLQTAIDNNDRAGINSVLFIAMQRKDLREMINTTDMNNAYQSTQGEE